MDFVNAIIVDATNPSDIDAADDATTPSTDITITPNTPPGGTTPSTANADDTPDIRVQNVEVGADFRIYVDDATCDESGSAQVTRGQHQLVTTL